MADLIESKVGDFSIGEAFSIGISKAVTERILSPVIGNGNWKSGAIKLVLAYVIPKYAPFVKGKEIGKIIGTGLAVDGVEDIVQSAMQMAFGNNGSSSTGALI